MYPEGFAVSTNQEVFNDLLAIAKKHSPKTRVVPKATVWWHRAIDKILKVVGNDSYLDGYWTTIGFTIYQPGDEVNEDWWSAIPHEGGHSIQAKKWTRPLFGSLYLMGTPVWLLPAVLFSWPFFVWLPWWSGLIFVLAFLLLSFPPFGFYRAHWEFQMYGLSLAMRYWQGGDVSSGYIETRAKQFTGPDYFYMHPYRRSAEKKLREYVEMAKTGKIFDEPYGDYMKEVYKVLVKHNRVQNHPARA